MMSTELNGYIKLRMDVNQLEYRNSDSLKIIEGDVRQNKEDVIKLKMDVQQNAEDINKLEMEVNQLVYRIGASLPPVGTKLAWHGQLFT